MSCRLINTPVRRAHLGLSALWLLVCVSAGLWLLLGSGSKQTTLPQAAVQRTGLSAGQPADGLGYRAIEQVRVGERVVTPGTDAAESLPTAVDPATWKLLTLRLAERWEDGTLDVTEIRTLQPPQWLLEHSAAVGARVPVPLDLEEMGLRSGEAEVVSIEPCPPIAGGPGRVVLTTVNHLNNFLFRLTLKEPSGAQETLGVTGWHKLYSEDRGWVSVCELRLGETLAGHGGPVAVAELRREPGVHRVYNMTVEAEHVYYVGGLATLAHNNDCRKVFVDASRHPHSARHLEDAGVIGRPLTVNRAGAAQNRADALRGRARVPRNDLDEAPAAVLRQPGDPVSVRPIPSGDNRGSGSSLGHQLRGVPDGGQVIIQIR
jgi:hypothetical protein